MAEAPSTDLVAHDDAGLDRLSRRPIIDSVDSRTLTLIKAQVAKNCTDAEVGYFLELAAHYDLDPFAREIWCAKDDKPNARVLIMVGRDGLRKIAQRQGLHIDGDVVRAQDEFKVTRGEHGRVVHHAYGLPEQRGGIVGAWCDVTDGSGRSVGYFYAPLSEYKPANVNQYSPWAKQTSVMILAAAERQALRQATPLSGLLAEGEDESAKAIGTGTGNGEEPGWGSTSVESAAQVEAVLERARALGHSGLSERATAQMGLAGQPDSVIAMWCEQAGRELDEFEARRESQRAEVSPEPVAPRTEAEHEAAQAELDSVLDRISAEEAEDEPDEAVLTDLRDRQEALEDALGHDDGQESMPL